jgi:serine/threonine protein kinase
LADVRAVCAGLAAIHTVGFIHRDVTPQNVLRMTDGRLVLSDFGLAIEGTDTTVHGGTPSYMSPEAALGLRPDQRSDVWQLGVILHELLFRRRPDWQAARSGVILREPARPGASGFERQLGRLCAACLAQNPADRPPNAMAVSAQLAALELGSPRIALRQLLRERPAFLVISGVLVGGLIWAGVAHRSERRTVERSVPPGITAADRRFLRSLAEEMKVQGRLNEAGSLNRLAGLPASP